MKQYTIDELRIEDYYKIRSYMEEFHNDKCIDGIYRIFLDKDILTQEQASHSECAPFYFALELSEQMVTFEFLVRAKNIIRCSCIRYADKRQLNWLIDYVNSVLNRLNIIT